MATIYSLISAYRPSVQREAAGQATIAWIDCDTVDGHLVRINFIADGMGLTPNRTDLLLPDYPEFSNLFFVLISAPASRFIWYLDLLRNEEPYVRISTDDVATNRIACEWSGAAWGHID